MTTNVILYDLLAFNKHVLAKLKVPTKTVKNWSALAETHKRSR